MGQKDTRVHAVAPCHLRKEALTDSQGSQKHENEREGKVFLTPQLDPLNWETELTFWTQQHIGLAPGVCHFVSSICTNTDADALKEHLMFP